MSRDSGAGAYSHGIACPSPSPQLVWRRSARRDEARARPVGHGGIMAPAAEAAAIGGGDGGGGGEEEGGRMGGARGGEEAARIGPGR